MAAIVRAPKYEIESPEMSEQANILIYGETGAGKTRLAGSAAEDERSSPVLYLDFEGGSSTLRGIPNIDVTRPRDWDDMQEIYNDLWNGGTPYKTVVLDPLTELQQTHSMGMILGTLGKERNEAGRYISLKSIELANRADWNRSRTQMENTIRAFRDLAYLDDHSKRVNVILTAMERYDEQKKTICPALPGVLGLQCGRFVDVLARLSSQLVLPVDEDGGVVADAEPEEHRHLLTTKAIGMDGITYLAKNRGGALGRQMWDPTMTSILDAWGEYDKG